MDTRRRERLLQVVVRKYGKEGDFCSWLTASGGEDTEDEGAPPGQPTT